MGSRRQIIKIDHEKCTGCGDCIPGCPEGALQVVDGKARLISDLFCDGLGACIGTCPEGAIEIEEREAEPYDERKVMENIVRQGDATIKAHLEHLKNHGAVDFYNEAAAYLKEKGLENPVEEAAKAEATLPCGCPGSAVMDFSEKAPCDGTCPQPEAEVPAGERPSRLTQWPVQLMLVPPSAPYLKNAELVIAADCTPFAFADFHEEFIKGKALLVGCPKLDDADFYIKKLAEVFKQNNIRSVTVVRMEVPCCGGITQIVKQAVSLSGKTVPYAEVVISVQGKKL